MSFADASAGAGIPAPDELIAAAQEGVREVVASGGDSGRSGRRWIVPAAAAAAVAAAACTPVAWPLLQGGTQIGAAALAAAFAQVGGVGSGLLSEAVIRAWDRLRDHGDSAGRGELREALAVELTQALGSSSAAAAGLRAEVAGVLRGVDAVQVALTTTIETTVQESGDQIRGVLIRGLRELGTRFAEFRWLQEEVSDQLTQIAQAQAELVAGNRAMLEAQQRTLMQLTLLRQQTHAPYVEGGGHATITGSSDQERAAALEAAGMPVSLDCPYPGLAAFGPQDAGRFFGREQLTAVLVTRLAEQVARPGLLMVLGPSGSGKSSLLRAGLLPEIAAGRLPVKGSGAWPLDCMTPGRRPLLELATRIAVLASLPAGALHADLCTDPARITAAIRQALLTHGLRQAQYSGPADAGHDSSAGSSTRLVLIIDQFEELFTQCTDEHESRMFIQALCAAAGVTGSAEPRNSPDAQALVVIGMRADFYARGAAYPELVRYLQDCQVVGPMDETGLRAAIEGPATEAGLIVDEGLADMLLTDLGLHLLSAGPPDSGSLQPSPDTRSYEAGRLPLLGYALQQTWQHRQGRRLSVAAYQATGRIDGAVARAAEAVYGALDTDGKRAARRLLRRMVSLGDDGEGFGDTRRRVIVSEVTGATTLTDPAGPAETRQAAANRVVLTDLVQARLVTADVDTGGTETVQISHDALLRAWPRLRQWLNQDRTGQRIHRDLTDAAHAWKADHDSGRLIAGTRLATISEWADSHEPDLNDGERAFLLACETAAAFRARRRRRRFVVLTMLATVTSLLAVATSIVSVFAFQQRTNALQQRDQATDNQVKAESIQYGPSNTALAAQLDIAAYRMQSTTDVASRLLSTENTPMSILLTGGSGSSVLSVAFSPDGRTLAGGDYDGTVWLRDVADPAHPRPLGPPLTDGTGNAVYAVAFSPDGRTLASGNVDGTVWLRDVADPAHPRSLGQALASGSDVDVVAFSPDGRTLASGNFDGTVRMWDVADPAHPRPLGRPMTTGSGNPGGSGSNAVLSVAFSPDGRTLAGSNFDGTVWLGDVADPAHPRLLGQPLASVGAVNAVAFSPDGRTLAGGNGDGTVRMWDVADTAHPGPLGQPLASGNGNGVNAVAFSPDGRTLAGGNVDGTVGLWDVADPAHPRPLGQPLANGSNSAIHAVAFSPNGHTLASGSDDGTVRLWILPQTVLTSGSGGVASVAFSPDRRTLAGGNGDGTVGLWDVADPAHPRLLGQPLASGGGGVNAVAFSPDGRTLASGNGDGTVRMWDVADPAHPRLLGQPLISGGNQGGGVHAVAFSPDRRTLASGNVDGTVRMWDVADPAHPRLLGQPLTSGTGSAVFAVAFSPDGRTLASGNINVEGSVRLWDVADPAHPRLLGQPLTSGTGNGGGSSSNGVLSVAFSPDGRTLAGGNYDGSVWLWDVADPAHPRLLGEPLTSSRGNGVYAVAFSPDGRTLASGNVDGTVGLWDVTDLAHPGQLGPPLTSGRGDSVYAVAFSADGRTLASGSNDSVVRLWDLNINHAIERVCAIAGDLTLGQWQQYVGRQVPYQPLCVTP
jgi:WD40 repeat protein